MPTINDNGTSAITISRGNWPSEFQVSKVNGTANQDDIGTSLDSMTAQTLTALRRQKNRSIHDSATSHVHNSSLTVGPLARQGHLSEASMDAGSAATPNMLNDFQLDTKRQSNDSFTAAAEVDLTASMMTGSKKRIAPQSTSQERRAVKKTLRMPNTIGNNASKHFPKDFFHLKKGQQKRDGTGTSVHCNRNELVQPGSAQSIHQDTENYSNTNQSQHGLDPDQSYPSQSAVRSTAGVSLPAGGRLRVLPSKKTTNSKVTRTEQAHHQQQQNRLDSADTLSNDNGFSVCEEVTGQMESFDKSTPNNGK